MLQTAQNNKKAKRKGVSPEGHHLHVMEPHGRYVQNLTIHKIALEALALLQQREARCVGSSGVPNHRLVAAAVKLQALTWRVHGDSLAAGDLRLT
jgi:hypothetical protein